MKTFKIIAMIFMIILLGTACDKNLSGGEMRVNLTDAPSGAYESVFIDLQKVMIHYEGTPDEQWAEVRSNPGIYDLLSLRNNLSVVIAHDEKLALGKVSQIRLVLGNANSVIISGIRYGLKIPSSATSGLKINMHETIYRNGELIVTLDFDADASVSLNGNGEYILQPVIKIKDIARVN